MIMCDIRLPSIHNGVYWLSYWLSEWPHAGGVLMSGELTEAVQDQIEQEGLLLLEKPVDPDILLKTLHSLRRSS
jgi:DNA-binding NtrC family response regulator